MKSASAALQTILATNGPFFIVDLYVISLGAQNYYYNSSDRDFVFDGQNYIGTGPSFVREKTSSVLGLESSTARITVMANPEHLLGTKPWIQAVSDGDLDGEVISVSRLFCLDPDNISVVGQAGSLSVMVGEIRDTRITDNEAQLTIVTGAYKFNTLLPINAYGPSCSNTLYDLKCGVNKASHNFTAITESTGATNFKFIVYGITNDYLLGTVEFLDGPNEGIKRTITSVDVGTEFITVSQPFPVQPSGEEVRVYKGCDRRLTTCTTRFSNQLNFRGYPYVPNPESIS